MEQVEYQEEESERLRKETEYNERRKVEDELEVSLKLLEGAEETERLRRQMNDEEERLSSEENENHGKKDLPPNNADLDRTTIENPAAAGVRSQLAQQQQARNSPMKGANASNLPPAGVATPAVKKPTLVASTNSVKGMAFDRQNSGSWLSGKPPSTSEENDHHGDAKTSPQTVNAVAMYDYVHPDPLAREFFSFKAGDIFTILPSERDLQGWKIAVSANGEKGFVPGNYLRYLQTEGEQEVKKDTVAASGGIFHTSNSVTSQVSPAQNGNSKPLKTTSQGKDEKKKNRKE